MRKCLTERIDGSVAAVQSLRDRIDAIIAIVECITAALKSGHTLYTAGNGGSAAQAMHLTEELIGRYRAQRPAIRAICLNADPTALTCIANDFGFEQVFARQCEALLGPGDVLLVLSTSGNSANILNALDAARQRGAASVAILGHDGGKAAMRCDHALIVPAVDSAHIQEAHLAVIHLICEVMEGVVTA